MQNARQGKCAIKICGITDAAVAKAASSEDITHVGFVFAESKRQVTAGLAREIGKHVRAGVQRVGVFVDMPLTEMVHVGQEAELDVYQLHGEESPELCYKLKLMTGKNVWKAWRVCHSVEDRRVKRYAGVVDAILLDSFGPSHKGGTGHPFAWSCIPQFRQWTGTTPLFVAGGLTADNVADLLRNYHPDGVDVSSGVETDGRKDPLLIKRFVQKVRECE